MASFVPHFQRADLLLQYNRSFSNRRFWIRRRRQKRKKEQGIIKSGSQSLTQICKRAFRTCTGTALQEFPFYQKQHFQLPNGYLEQFIRLFSLVEQSPLNTKNQSMVPNSHLLQLHRWQCPLFVSHPCLGKGDFSDFNLAYGVGRARASSISIYCRKAFRSEMEQT